MGNREREIGIYAVFAYLQLRVEESEINEVNNVGELLEIKVIADEVSVTLAPHALQASASSHFQGSYHKGSKLLNTLAT